MSIFPPRILLSALRGGSGKTMVTLGLAASWKERGIRVATFKKGPDYIDAGWLSFASGQPCHNLDPFLMTDTQIVHSFVDGSAGADISLIEGNRGLFDGLDVEGRSSTAKLGKLLHAPVIIIIDVTMVTRTTAALVMGCQRFDPSLHIASVILNRVGSSRQESLVRNAIEQYCGIPVVGSIPKLKGDLFPERHMGLVPHLENTYAEKAMTWVKDVIEKHVDLQALWKIAQTVSSIPREINKPLIELVPLSGHRRPRIGVIRDKAFWFYYPENLEQLQKLGALLLELNSLSDRTLPELDALYIGGGFPETHAERLAGNVEFIDSVRRGIERGLPVYAECGGLMYLGEEMVIGDLAYPMVGALPMKFILEKKPQGHGYTLLEVSGKNPYYPLGARLKGHEFHYSRPVITRPEEINPVFKVLRGRGLDGKRDGLCKHNLLATYTHIHGAGNLLFGQGLLHAALHAPTIKEEGYSDEKKRKIDIDFHSSYRETL